MSHTNGHSRPGFLYGLVFGGLAGATAAILLAPRSGEATRDLIRQEAVTLRDRAATAATETRAQIAGLASRVQGRASELAEGVRAGAETLQQKGQAYAEVPRQ